MSLDIPTAPALANLASTAGHPATASHDIPTPAELVRRAEEIAPTLVSRMGETEKRGHYAEDTHEIFKESGFYRILSPKKYGGYEMGIDTFSEVVKAIARGCPSTAWCLCFGAAHSVNVCTMYPQDTWDEIFQTPDFISPMTVKPQGELVQQEDGGWRLSGIYDYCSGVPYASHFSSQAIPVFLDGKKGAPVTFLACREDWTMLDNWGDGDMLGMNGSGSNSIRFDNAYIPDRFVLRKEILTQTPSVRDPANPEHGDSAIYYGRFVSFLIMEPAAIAVGAMKGALDEFGELMKTRTTMRPPIQLRAVDTDYRRWYGNAMGQIAVAEAALQGMTRQWMEAAQLQMEGKKAFSVADEIAMIYIAGEVIRIAWDAMNILWVGAGSTAARRGSRLQVIFRDLACARNHALNTFTDLMSRELSDLVLDTQAEGLDSFFSNSYKNTGTQR